MSKKKLPTQELPEPAMSQIEKLAKKIATPGVFFDDLLNLLTYLTKTETYLDLLQRSVGKEGCDRTVPYSLARRFECFFTPINVLCHSLLKFPRKFACYLI